MRVIKAGAKPEDKLYQAACMHCKTEVEFARHEAKYNPDQRDGDFLSVNCPICSHLIAVAI
jgi:DNA-directed RNA polymerase subunit RPC12/RpoP